MQITPLLRRLETGEREVLNVVIPLVYDELKRLARMHLRREAAAQSLQPTALVHEAFLKFAGSRHPSYENRSHFFGLASRLMRQILVDAARARATDKRDASREVALAEASDPGSAPCRHLLALDDALQQLERTDPMKAQLIEMSYFGGMTAEESSVAISKPVHFARRELRLAKAWLRREISGSPRQA